MPSPCFFPSPPRVCEVSAVCFCVYLWPPVSLPPLSPVLVHPVPPSVSLLFYVSLCLSPFPIILRHDSAWPSRDNTFHRQIAQQRQKNMLQVNVRGQALLHVLWRGRRGEGRREVSQVGVPPTSRRLAGRCSTPKLCRESRTGVLCRPSSGWISSCTSFFQSQPFDPQRQKEPSAFVFLTGSGVGEGKEEKEDAKRGHTGPFEPYLCTFLVGDLSVNGHM